MTEPASVKEFDSILKWNAFYPRQFRMRQRGALLRHICKEGISRKKDSLTQIVGRSHFKWMQG